MAELTILGALQNAVTREKALTPISSNRGWWSVVREPFAGAWQRNMEEKHGTVLCYPTLYACLNRISQDIGKLPFVLKQLRGDGIWEAVENPAYSPVLRKPNTYQTAQQFREAWILSKLIHGNAYILKGRDERGVVTRLYVLDPCRVLPMVTEYGRYLLPAELPVRGEPAADRLPGRTAGRPRSGDHPRPDQLLSTTS